MLYIVTEDEGSGFQFWKSVADNLLINQRNITLTTSKGVANIPRILKRLNLKLGDTLLLAVDAVYDNSSASIKDIFELALLICHRAQARLIRTTYYCFEEVFLSYNKIEFMCKGQAADRDRKLIVTVRNSIYNQVNYAQSEALNDSLLPTSIKKTGSREKLAKALLSYITFKMAGMFKVVSGTLGRCWIDSCNDLRQHKSKILTPQYCSKCSYACKEGTAISKLEHLDENTLFNQNGKLNLRGLVQIHTEGN